MISGAQPEQTPETQPAFLGGPPRPPKKTARGLEDDDDSFQEPHLDLPDPVLVRDLASKLNVKPFVIVGDLMKLGVWAEANQTINFETASKIVWNHGYYATRGL